MPQFSVPILTYHASNVYGDEYANNDHVALEQDLMSLHDLGYKIIPLKWIAQWLDDERDITLVGSKLVAISCDDGLDLEFFDGNYFDYGKQISFYNILSDFLKKIGKENQPHACITSFVIASPKARKIIDSKSLQSQNLMNDSWWLDACKTGLFSIENHSWDHYHPDIYPEKNSGFMKVNDKKSCNQQLVQSKNYINQIIKPYSSCLFAYPWGQFSDYLAHHFFQAESSQHGIKAAFTCEPKPVTKKTNKWLIPRFVCGNHWKTKEQLKHKILSIEPYSPNFHGT
ncbi:MAG: polysaccharide deacetylase family protein [Proteobacteria bacterium]|nr:polysaccharide deacetylase family protein [Pseudomonadota bacterium]